MGTRRVLLTGATGFIGSQVARALLESGHTVFALTRKGASLWRLDDVVPRLELVHGELTEPDDIEAVVKDVRPELCVHSAWYTEPGRYLSSSENVRLANASLFLSVTLARHGCKRLVGVGTCLEYDTNADGGTFSEITPVGPRHLYSESKLSTYQFIEALGRRDGMATSWARVFYQYGPYEDERRLVPHVIRKLLAGERAQLTPGEQVRDFLHVSDVGRAIAAVGLSDVGGVVNIGSGVPLTVRALATEIGRKLDALDRLEFGAVPYSPGDPMYICANNRRLTQDVGFTPRHSLSSGLDDTIAWWKHRLSH